MLLKLVALAPALCAIQIVVAACADQLGVLVTNTYRQQGT